MSVGGRIRLGRKAGGLSQRALAKKCGLSAMAISKYERDTIMPSSSSLLAIARALGVTAEFLLRSTEVRFSPPLFRCRRSLPAKQQAAVLAKAQEHVERYVELEDLLNVAPMFSVPNCANFRIQSLESVEEVASGLRSDWDLGKGPIENLMEVLEEHGIKVAVVDAYSAFDALVVEVPNEGPVIVVKKGEEGDRQRFTLAHELGHLIVNHGEDVDAEKVANRFAGAFLVPREVAIAELGQHRSRLRLEELCELKRKYGMSIAAWIYRAKDLGIVSNTYFVSLFRAYRSRGMHRGEPCSLEPEHTSRMSRLVQRAIAEGLISRTKAMELSNAVI